MDYEAPPIPERTICTNTHCDPQREPCPHVKPLSDWNNSPHMGLAKPLVPQSQPELEMSSHPYSGYCSGIPLWWDT